VSPSRTASPTEQSFTRQLRQLLEQARGSYARQTLAAWLSRGSAQHETECRCPSALGTKSHLAQNQSARSTRKRSLSRSARNTRTRTTGRRIGEESRSTALPHESDVGAVRPHLRRGLAVVAPPEDVLARGEVTRDLDNIANRVLVGRSLSRKREKKSQKRRKKENNYRACKQMKSQKERKKTKCYRACKQIKYS
jgi:hypothetical protein